MTTFTDLLQAHSATRLLADPARHACAGCGEPVDGTMADHQADVLEAAGAVLSRTITTRAELDALPDEAVIRDADEYVFERLDGRWYTTEDSLDWAAGSIAFPATVLHEGNPE